MFEVLRNLFNCSTTPSSTAVTTAAIPPATTAASAPDAYPSANSVPVVFADTETTGLNQDGTDEIVEVAIVDADGTVLLDTLVRPVRNTAWPEAQAIHGICPQDVLNAPTLGSLLPKIAAICAGRTVVFYNAPFDTSFFPKDFFSSVVCAMRRLSQLSPERRAWAKLSDAASASGYVSNRPNHRALADALACRHIWLFGIPPLEEAYPPIDNPRITAELVSETEGRITLLFNMVFSEELRFVTVNSQCNFWTKDDREEINVYRSSTLGGSGKVATLSKADNPELAKRLAAGYKIEMQLSERRDNVLLFNVVAKPSRKAIPEVLMPTGAQVAFSPIDDDISRCFIAHQSGMCDAIGTWDAFRNVEHELVRICKDRGGRYHKSKAKGAKFAIIFSPYARTASEVWSLQQSGYKVTTFDRAVSHFGLTHLWDCPRYLAYVERLKGTVDILT